MLAAEFRDARMIRAEEKAARLPALLTVPMILFILPTLFIVLLGPAALGIIDTFNRSGGQKHVTVVTHDDRRQRTGDETPERPKIAEVHRQRQVGSAARASSVEQTPRRRPSSRGQIVAAGQPIAVSVDARALADSSDLRIIIVPRTRRTASAIPRPSSSTRKQSRRRRCRSS